MPSQPVESEGKRTICLSLLPPELAIEIFRQLPSFSDVFALSATCHQLRNIWLEHLTPIYNHVAPRSIACETQAREILIDQGGPAFGCRLSAKDVVRMVQNSRIVEKAIREFERKFVCRVKTKGYSASKYYGVGAIRHPSILTCTERPRFIRSYYIIWGMMNDPSKWSSKLESMTLKQLYRLHEMTTLIDQGEELIPPSMLPDKDHYPVDSTFSDRFQVRIDLNAEVGYRIQPVSWRVFNQTARQPWSYSKSKTFGRFLVFWDHWQETFKEMVCCRPTIDAEQKPSPAVEKQYLWDDSSDDEQ